MTRSDPLPSTGKRHPIFARVFARAGPAMDAQGALDHRRALLAGLGPAGSWRSVPAAASTSPTTRQRSPNCSPSSLSRTSAPWPKPPPSRLPSPSAWSTAPPMTCPVPMPAWTPPSHPWCCARCPTKAAPWLNCAGYYAPVASFASSSTSKPTPPAWPGPSASPTSSGPPLLVGCHTSRDTLTAITTAGFRLISTRRFRFPDSRLPSPAAPHLLGIGRRPPEPDRRGAIGSTSSPPRQL